MKLEKFTLDTFARFGQVIRMSFLPALLMLIYGGLTAQTGSCPLACNNLVQVSMDDDCVVEITPDMMLEGNGLPANCTYTVQVIGLNGQPLPPPLGLTGNNWVTRSQLNQSLQVRVWLGNNHCWGKILVEDKLAPTINCLPNVTVACYASLTVPVPTATDNCTQLVTASVVSDVVDDLPCTSPFSAIRTITYTAQDLSGNVSVPCVRTISYTREALTAPLFQFPRNKDDVQDPAFNCDNSPVWDVVKADGTPGRDNYPQPSESGVPTIGGVPLFPNNTYCELNATFTDQVVPICLNSFKVLRHWTVLDWCTGTIAQSYQIIKIIDDKPPVVTILPNLPPNITVSNCLGNVASLVEADPYTCLGTWNVVVPTVNASECSGWTYTVAFILNNGTEVPPVNGIYIQDNGTTKVIGNAVSGYQIIGLPQGCAWIRYTVTDGCGNSTQAFTEIFVRDLVPPTPVCDQFTVVTLSNNGWAHVFAETFDDGSHDNCSTVTFRVRRMSSPQRCNLPGAPNTHSYGPFVTVCCDDVGRELMVELEVRDASNNVNTCMVNLRVDDKINPSIVCPAPITISCGDDIVFGTPVGSDNCGTPTITIQSTTGVINSCGQGSRTRTWIATDAGGRTATCSQTITVRNTNPYTGPTASQWPTSPVDIEGCINIDTDPSKTGRPIITSNPECSQVAHTYEDQVFNFVDGVCYKILRKWTVIDWCKFAPNTFIGTNNQVQTYPSAPTTGVNTWTFTQIIKVNNTDKPVIQKCSNVTECGFGPNCDGYIELVNTATDLCTPASELKWSYAISPFDTGLFTINGNRNDASGTYPVGTHRIRWTVEDKCGNQTTCEHLFTINDCKKPTPYCISEITTVIMPTSGNIDIWAKDFDLGSTDNCSGQLRYTFDCARPVPSRINQTHYFRGNGILATEGEYLAGTAQLWRPADNSSAILFDCDDLGINTVNMCVIDAAGNTDFCTVTVNIQANGTACSGARIAGDVGTEDNEMIESVIVTLENMTSNETKAYMTPETGHYEFAGMPEQQSYKINAERNDDYMNGVSTLDLVLIQRHILSIENLNSPYKLIAADVNNDKKINTVDLVELRKLILGVYSELPNNKSWRFIDKAYTMTDPTFPWPFNEYISINNFNNSMMNNHFVGVKIGDVNKSAKVNVNSTTTESRNAKTLKLVATDAKFTAEKEVVVDITADNFNDMVGAQFTINFDGAQLQYTGIQKGALGMDETNVNSNLANDGKLAFSWNNVDATSFDRNEVLFSITFRATTNGTISKAIYISSDITKTESYTHTLEVMNVDMEIRTKSANNAVAFDLYQNNPNPFVDQTVIGFNLPKAADATLNLYDITGKLLKSIKSNYPAGYNEIIIGDQDNLTSGIILYELESNGYKATKKMIFISK